MTGNRAKSVTGIVSLIRLSLFRPPLALKRKPQLEQENRWLNLRHRQRAQGGMPITLVLLTLAMILSEPLSAARLDDKTCADLRKSLAEIKTDESVKAMQKGFEWVRDNIQGEKLRPIQKFIELNEQIKFRCTGKDPVLPETQVPITVTIDWPVKKPEGADEEHEQQKEAAKKEAARLKLERAEKIRLEKEQKAKAEKARLEKEKQEKEEEQKKAADKSEGKPPTTDDDVKKSEKSSEKNNDNKNNQKKNENNNKDKKSYKPSNSMKGPPAATPPLFETLFAAQ